MGHSQLEHKRIWLEKLEKDLSELKSLGYEKNSETYKEAKWQTNKARKNLNR
ncbi:Uncharacterised protein [Enterococcus faecium]|nr:Uncharacterised protein [Enterococcus faecium]SMJ23364.1 Uncharacterised protein [Enterococcus faecium]SMJ29352.1 Uncharacterised protein [Enterococcus faecium]SMJ29930.1 Uncharacterised protein [Enterococcus faecium]SMJ58803.1 Uncharacterised protein [Enterococcus faecium]